MQCNADGLTVEDVDSTRDLNEVGEAETPQPAAIATNDWWRYSPAQLDTYKPQHFIQRVLLLPWFSATDAEWHVQVTKEDLKLECTIFCVCEGGQACQNPLSQRSFVLEASDMATHEKDEN